MADLNHVFSGDNIAEGSGTILFRLSTREICLLYHIEHEHYVLPKGRRNVGECRRATALRETTEETGYPCHLLPVEVYTTHAPDEPRPSKYVCEPMAMQTRHVGDRSKPIWWYVAAVSEEEPVRQHEDKFKVEFFSYQDAVRKLRFPNDRFFVKTAIRLVEAATRGE